MVMDALYVIAIIGIYFSRRVRSSVLDGKCRSFIPLF